MWSAISKKYGETQTGTVVLFGRAAASGFSRLGPVSKNTEIATLNKLVRASEDGSMESTLNIFRIREAQTSMVKHITFKGSIIIVYALDWAETEQWPAHIDALVAARAELDPAVKLLLTTTNHRNSIEYSQAAAAFSKSVDLCHQYLRTSAMRLRAALAYSMENEDALDWEALLSHVLGVAFADREPPQEQYHGPTAIIYGDDSKEKILAVDPEFDFDRAYENQLSVPSLTSDGKTEQSAVKVFTSLPEELAQTIKEFATTKRLPDAPVSRAVLDGADDKKVISEFFSTIAQRST